MEQLILSLQELLFAVWHVVVSLLVFVVPWTPLLAWIAFWLLAVNWEKLYPVLAKGGIVGVMLVGLVAVLVWGLIAPPGDGAHYLFGLKPSNFVMKTVYVTMLLTIAALCGSVQLSGACGSLVCFCDDESEGRDSSGNGHAADGHGHSDHGHDDHTLGHHGETSHGH